MESLELENYSVYFDKDISSFRTIYQDFKYYQSVFVLADSNTEAFCLPLINDQLPDYKLITFQAGEKNKNIETCIRIWNELNNKNAGRKSLLINIGGGVVGDIGGFAAGTFKRGFDFINIPTTLLSQVDASVGGKTGIDLNGIKNIIGLFHDPQLIFICDAFLKTLPEEELRSGFAEVLKHGLICDDAYWHAAKKMKLSDENDWLPIIKRSVQIKAEIVRKDPHEKGLRKVLNFGHTIGHALETLSLQTDKPLLHGEAIAAGMICEAWISSQLLGLSTDELNDIVVMIFSHFEKENISNYDIAECISVMKLDKKNDNGEMNFSLLNKIGDCTFDIPVTEILAARAIKFYIDL